MVKRRYVGKRKVLIIGVGGIGSYLVPMIHRTGKYIINISDPDSVEQKNLYSQNYCVDDCGLFKVNCLLSGESLRKRSRYPVLTDKQLNGYDLIICCADNLDVRRLVYRKGFQSDCGAKWLDLRAQGRNGALISYLTDPKYSDTFLTGPEGSFSCQGESFDKSNDTKDIHFTHAAIAAIGAQWMQRWFNGDEVKDKMVINI